MIKSFKSKALAELFSTGRTAKIDAKMHKRILVRLDRLDAASRVEEMYLRGFDFHALRGFKPTRYTVHVNGPWCIMFGFEEGDAYASISSSITDEGLSAMTEFSAERPLERCPSHPGALLDDILPATGKSKTEIASLLGISRQHLYDILREAKPVSPHVAARLGKLFGDGAAVWLRMQAAYDAWHAEREVDLSNVPTLQPV